jgi:5-methylthioadenosine/S-adenosylhomocysteine deaminase
MATIEGARSAGLGDEVGSLEAGKQADLVRWRPRARRHRLDLTELNLSPVLEAPVRVSAAGGPTHLVYAGSGHEVVTVMVAGKMLVRDSKVLAADEAAVRAEAQLQAEEVARRVTADPVQRGMALLEAMEAGQL